jgi:RimJ/RimL family protein N-acetyltransferase
MTTAGSIDFTTPDAGRPLPEATLARRTALPLKPAAVTLAGRLVTLRPLDLDRDVPPLYARTNGRPATLGERAVADYDPDEVVWRYMSGGPFESAAALGAWLHGYADAPDTRTFCVLDNATGEAVGATNYMANAPAHLKVELGGIVYSPLAQRTGANLEATYLMLRHAFDLGYRRLEWKCDSLNERSRRAALRMGFRFEGIQEYHYVVKGRNRDTAWFRILDREWPDVRAHLERLLAAI